MAKIGREEEEFEPEKIESTRKAKKGKQTKLVDEDQYSEEEQE